MLQTISIMNKHGKDYSPLTHEKIIHSTSKRSSSKLHEIGLVELTKFRPVGIIVFTRPDFLLQQVAISSVTGQNIIPKP